MVTSGRGSVWVQNMDNQSIWNKDSILKNAIDIDWIAGVTEKYWKSNG